MRKGPAKQPSALRARERRFGAAPQWQPKMAADVALRTSDPGRGPLRHEAGDEENERDDDGQEDADPQHQPAQHDQRRRLRLALTEFLREAMRLLARMRGEPLGLLGEFRVQVVVRVARWSTLARRPAGIGRALTLFVHRRSFAAAEGTWKPSKSSPAANRPRRSSKRGIAFVPDGPGYS
jgi:hypothetical protein